MAFVQAQGHSFVAKQLMAGIGNEENRLQNGTKSGFLVEEPAK
jgi:hypothetical protein